MTLSHAVLFMLGLHLGAIATLAAIYLLMDIRD